MPWGGYLSELCHKTHTQSHPRSCIVHLPVLCIAHLKCGFRHRFRLSLPLRCLICSYYVTALMCFELLELSHQCLGQCINVLQYFTLLVRVVLYVTSFFVHSLYLIGLVLPMSLSFSLTLSTLIKVNLDKDYGSSLEAVAFSDMLA